MLLLFIKGNHYIIYFIVFFFPGAKASKQVVLDLPDNVVEESARAFFTVVGRLVKLVFHTVLKVLIEVISKKSLK